MGDGPPGASHPLALATPRCKVNLPTRVCYGEHVCNIVSRLALRDS
jgi:hypothetical protein